MYAHTVATAVGDANWRIMESTFGASSTVAATFATVIKVLEDSILEFKEYSIKIWIRRPGPNYRDGLGVGQRSWLKVWFADGSVRPRDSHRCRVAHGVGIAARVG